MQIVLIIILSIYNVLFLSAHFLGYNNYEFFKLKSALQSYPIITFAIEFLLVISIISHMVLEWDDEDKKASKRRLFFAALFGCLFVVKIILRFIDGMMVPS